MTSNVSIEVRDKEKGSPRNRLASPEAEQAIISAILRDPSILGWLDLSLDHFVAPIHKQVFVAMRSLYDEDKPVDEVTIIDAVLAVNSRIDLSAVSKIMITSITADNAEYWVSILEESRRMRILSKAMAHCGKIISGEIVGDSGTVQDELFTEMEALSLSKSKRSSDMLQATDKELARMEAQWDGGDNPRYPLGIYGVDDASGGAPIGVLTSLGARTGTGKSTFLWNIMRAASARGDHALVLSNEDRPDVMARLGIAYMTGIERRDLLSGRISADQRDLVRTGVAQLREINSRIHTLRIHGRSMRDICREATGLIRRYGIKIAALDYIQNTPSPAGEKNRSQGIEQNLTTLEAMVADEDIAMLVVGQLKRINEDRAPVVEDLKDSGALEQKSKLILLLSEGEQGSIEVDIAKNSEGRKSSIVRLNVDFGTGRIS